MKKKTTEELKLNIQCHAKNPLRDRLRAMSDAELMNEKANAWKAQKQKDSRANFNYAMFIDYLCETRKITKANPGVWV
jgi:hypothetical protein